MTVSAVGRTPDRSGQLVVPRRRMAAGGVLGPFAGVPAGLDPGAEAAGRPELPRLRPGRRRWWSAAFVSRLAVLFGLLPLFSLARLTKPISKAYKIAIAWGGLRGALTLGARAFGDRELRGLRFGSGSSSRCWRRASCSSRCWSTGGRCALSSAPSDWTGYRRPTRCCATGC